MKITKMLLVMVCALVFGAVANADEKIVVEGSSTVGPIAKAFAEYLMEKDKTLNITVNESGSGNGAQALIDGQCQVADMSRFMKGKEFKAAVANGAMPTATAVAMDGIAMIVNPVNSVKNLTVEEARRIYKGEITNWKELKGPDMPIIIISRDSSSGTYETFEGLVMKKEKISSNAEYVGSNGQMRARVQSTKGAIGYVGLGFVDKTVKALTVNNIPATKKTVASGVYPIARALFMFTNGYPKPGTNIHKFITMYLSDDGQSIIERIGFIPVTSYE